MAQIKYKEGYEPISGIYCNAEYKSYASGRTTMFVLPLPSAEEAKNSPALRAERIVKLCVSDIQKQMHNVYEAVRQYKNITQRVQRLYSRMCEIEPDDGKLQKAITDAYFQSRRVLPSRKVRLPELGLVPT